MDCEMCGRKSAIYNVVIEGAKLNVCAQCAKYGKIVSKASEGKKEQKFAREIPAQKEPTEIQVVEDYGKKIVTAREKRSMSLGELARKINEVQSYLDRVEKERVLPTEKLCKKLEKELGIALIEQVAITHSNEEHKKKDLTLGDVVNLKKKQNEE